MPLDFQLQVEEAFQQALDLDDAARPAFFLRLNERDPKLGIAVQQLLGALDRANGIDGWDAPALQSVASLAADMTGEATLDRYRLLERIGAGGMAIVHKAVRADDEFSKQVAVKIVHTPSPGAIDRFRKERQILAGLEHPNIARLLDGGTSGDGSPFLVMEYVEGVPLDRYVADQKLPLASTLDLFRKICSAVSYAHRNLIVHRDLKPANILVNAAGEPKLLDFGIAKLMDPATESTQTGFGAMTPEYASPEQVRGGLITTATDIYSLGVILYELLRGSRPYGNKGSAMELAVAITTESAEPLNSGTSRRFDSDLENIVQMSMRKEPERRYATVEQFSEDVRRYQNGYPVVSRPDTAAYRLRKFTGRNKMALLAASMVVLALASGAMITVRQMRIAQRRFDDVRKLANYFVIDVYDAIKDLPGATAPRQMIVSKGLEYLDSLSQERSGDRALDKELAAAYTKISAAQSGSWLSTNLGNKAEAMATFRKALAIREELVASDPRDLDAAQELAHAYAALGSAEAQYLGDIARGVATGRKGISLSEKLAAAQPHDRRIQDALAINYTLLGDSIGNSNYQNLGDTKGALELYRKGMAVWERLGATDPKDKDGQLRIAGTQGRIGQVLQSLDDKPGAVAAFRMGVEICERVLHDYPVNAAIQTDTAVANRNLSISLVRLEDRDLAQKYGERARQLFDEISNSDPNNLEARSNLGNINLSQGFILKDARKAIVYYEAAIKIYKEVMARNPEAPPPMGLLTSYQLRARDANKIGNPELAIASAQDELKIDAQLLKLNPANATAQRDRAQGYYHLGIAHEMLALRTTSAAPQRIAKLRAAISWFQKSIDVFTTQQKSGTMLPMYAKALDNSRTARSRTEQELARMGQ